MADVMLHTLSGNDPIMGGLDAITQLERQAPITFDGNDMTNHIPFHEVLALIVESREVTPVTPSDANCAEGGAECEGLYWYAYTPLPTALQPGNEYNIGGDSYTLMCYTIPNPTQDDLPISVSLVSKEGDITAEEVTDEEIGLTGIEFQLINSGSGSVTVRAETGCEATFSFAQTSA